MTHQVGLRELFRIHEGQHQSRVILDRPDLSWQTTSFPTGQERCVYGAMKRQTDVVRIPSERTAQAVKIHQWRSPAASEKLSFQLANPR
jgi:hypothetical protein